MLLVEVAEEFDDRHKPYPMEKSADLFTCTHPKGFAIDHRHSSRKDPSQCLMLEGSARNHSLLQVILFQLLLCGFKRFDP
jgi:hypothetical protein